MVKRYIPSRSLQTRRSSPTQRNLMQELPGVPETPRAHPIPVKPVTALWIFLIRWKTSCLSIRQNKSEIPCGSKRCKKLALINRHRAHAEVRFQAWYIKYCTREQLTMKKLSKSQIIEIVYYAAISFACEIIYSIESLKIIEERTAKGKAVSIPRVTIGWLVYWCFLLCFFWRNYKRIVYGSQRNVRNNKNSDWQKLTPGL